MKIVVICADAYRADAIGPKLQAWLDNNLEYTQAYSAAPATIPLIQIEYGARKGITEESKSIIFFKNISYSAKLLMDCI